MLKQGPSGISYYFVISSNYLIVFLERPFEILSVEGNFSTANQIFPTSSGDAKWEWDAFREGPRISQEPEHLKCTYSIAVWALIGGSSYKVELKVEDRRWTEDIQTTTNENPRSAEFFRSVVLDVDLLRRADADRLVLAQGNTIFLHLLLRRPLVAAACWVFYRGLFLLPSSTTPYLYSLPAPPNPFILDLASGADPSIWRRSKKMKKVITSNSYFVRVCTEYDEIIQCLRKAEEYHSVQNNGTWLNTSLIELLAEVNTKSPLSNVKVVCTEILNSEYEVVAGCCGISVGSVFQDFTMFTIRRQSLGFGTIASKVIAEALQQCGYNMWYWGIQLPYMKDFIGRYGGKELNRVEFYRRWSQFRDKVPDTTLTDYFSHGDGILPYIKIKA